MTHDNSDYEKVRTNLYDLLPEVYKSDVNEALFENLFNRFLTKQETEKVAGYIGAGNVNAIASRQVREPTVHRQAFQLQPILYNKIGSVEHMASWYDILNELERLGVDIERLPIWGAVQEFNWAPPIDIDKLINYQDYYWYDPENPSSPPQYITIRSRCATAVANANFWERLTDEFGLTIPIGNILSVDETLPTFDIESLNSVSQTVVVTGDATDYLVASNLFNISGTVANDGEHLVVSAPVYDGIFDTTSFDVAGTLVANQVSVGRVNLQRFDKIVVDGEYERLMDPGFVFFVTDSTNPDLNNAFWQVLESNYSEDDNETVIQLTTYVTSSIDDGVISNEEQLNFYLAERDCQCTGSVGWDLLQWDDNPEDPLWGGAFPGDHATLLLLISNAGPPIGVGASGQLWYDTIADQLFQYSDMVDNTGWFALYNNFSLILEKTEGMAFWDLTPGCGVKSRIPAADQWIDENKWLHETDVPNFSIAKQASYPIIEYDWDLELNEWATTVSKWQYRADKSLAWEDTDAQPSVIELQPLTWWETDVINDEILIDERYGDLTSFFTPGTNIQAVNTIDVYTVERSYYGAGAVGEPFNTRVQLTVSVAATSLISGDFLGLKPSPTGLKPNTSTQGDAWRDYGDQWLFVGYADTLPVPHQPNNPFTVIDETQSPIADPSGDYDYFLNYAAQAYVLAVAGVTHFPLSDNVGPNTLRSLHRRAMIGFDDVRVYVNGIRQYGNYDEIDEDIVEVVGVTSIAAAFPEDTFTFANDVQTGGHMNIGDTIRIESNIGGAAGDYLIESFVDAFTVKIDAMTPIIATATADGLASNVTTPMQDIDSPYATYATAITFLAGVNLEQFDIVKIEVGESNIEELGLYQNSARLDADNADFIINGFTQIGITESRRVEQVKSVVTQYPLFDIYNVDGSPANRANPIFGYRTDPTYPIVAGINLRIVRDADTGITEFDQFILDEDEGKLYAYRDYSNEINDFWFNPATEELMFWDDFAWNDKTVMGTLYQQAIVSDFEPPLFYQAIDGFYWYDTIADQLKRRTTVTNEWIVLPNVDRFEFDVTLQTIWKKGLNSEQYVPAKVDWERRTLLEYREEQVMFVEQRAQEIRAADPTLSIADSIIQANQEWLESQANEHSTTGEWVGAWEIPEPLYYNNQHENRKYLDSRELLTHFATIIEEQPKIPGYNGPKDSMFHLIPTDEVNYGLGGTIKEYNDGFDTFLSSIFINSVTPLRLIEFGHDQYETLLNTLKEIYRKDAIDIFSNTSTLAVLNISEIVTTALILSHELNDNAAYLYGDSTTFTDNDGLLNDTGIRNWIITQPYLKTLFKQEPYKISDIDTGFVEIVHHDGHRNQYALVRPLIENIINVVNNTADDRTRFPGPNDPALDTLGKQSTALPPNTFIEFDAEYNTDIANRSGVYWYTTQGTSRVWYRLLVASAGLIPPSSALADGTLWFDTQPGLETLRTKTTHPITGVVAWDVVPGLALGDGRLHNGTDPADLTTATTAAYQPININEYLNDAILEVETRLYENAPEPIQLAYDPVATRASNPVLFDSYLEQAFLDYALGQNIAQPFGNNEFDISDPFTWNYKYSTPGAGIEIIEADSDTNSFRVAGNIQILVDPCTSLAICPSSVTFFVKNSGINDGTWNSTSTIIQPGSFYDAGNNETIVFVNTPVQDSTEGILYSGILPSSMNDGSESGGDWRDYYQKLYNTPYPHLEPWKLQGYNERPVWWNEHYENTDPENWGIRAWNYRHGFDIIGVDAIAEQFVVHGNFREAFKATTMYQVDHSTGVHDGSYTIATLETIANVNLGLPGVGSIEIAGDATANMTPGLGIVVASLVGEVQQLATITSSFFALGTTVVYFAEPITTSTNWDIISGATFDAVSNTTTLTVIENITSAAIEGRLLNPWGMWEAVRRGVIPPGTTYSNGITSISGNPITDNSIYGLQTPDIPTYNYVSVNVDNVTVSADGGTTEYHPDQVFPPYWNFTPVYGAAPSPFDRVVRSVFSNFSSEVVAPGTDYIFNDSGDTEWEWRQTSQFLYDMLTASFRMDPVRYVADTFGVEYNIVNELEIDARQCNTPSHTRTDFHGDVIDDVPYLVNGTNQWYVNYNRYAGFDTTWSDFRSMWTLWTAPMMYQFSSFIDTPSLDVAQRQIVVSDFDHDVLAKRSPGVEDDWLDAFSVALTYIPPAIVRYDNQSEWRMEVNTNLPSSRTIQYYDVRNYQFYADTATDLCTLYRWDIAFADAFNDAIRVPGDQTHVFTNGVEFVIDGSTGNDGTYVTSYSVYNSVTRETYIELFEGNIAAPIADGTVRAIYRELPWQTGDYVVLSTDETLPYPLQGDNANGVYRYLIIVENEYQFRLALTPNDATTNTYVNITSSGSRDAFVGQIDGTFEVERSTTLWRRYTIDTTHTLTFATPEDISGMQKLVDIVLGYDRLTSTNGWAINSDMSERDPNNNSPVTWQTELERFINFAYLTRTSNTQVMDRYESTVNVATNEWTFLEPSAQFITGDKVTLLSRNGLLPTPLQRGLTYYMIRYSLTEFALAATPQDANNNVPIDVIDLNGSDVIWITIINESRNNAPRQEINPFRNAIWYRPDFGIVSNIITGPAEDVRTTQLIFDQYGRAIKFDDLLVMRQDRETKITYSDEVFNDVELTTVFQDPYNYLHMGGMHVFVDAYEHVLRFNDYTTENQLLYDTFLGLNVTKFEMLFNRQPEFTGRPNVGGYYLETFFNQGADLKQNIEAQTDELRYLYDTYKVIESQPMVAEGRAGLGYDGTKSYLDNLNLNQKSQFIFWRGFIQQKGSVNAVKAFVNSRRFIDAKVDEYWAIKIAEYGSAYEKEYPEMWITTADARSSDMRFQFVREDDYCNPGYAIDPYDKDTCGYAFPDSGEPVLVVDDGYTAVALSDQDRWFDQPDQLATLRNNGEGMYFDLEVTDLSAVLIMPPDDVLPDASTTERNGVVIHDTGADTYEFYTKDDLGVSWIYSGGWAGGESPILRHNFQEDYLEMRYRVYEPGRIYEPVLTPGDTDLTVLAYIPFTGMLQIYNNGALLTPLDDYTEVFENDLFSTSLVFNTPFIVGDDISIVYTAATLLEGDVDTETNHYSLISSNIVKLHYDSLLEYNTATLPLLTMVGFLFKKEAQNPAHLLDKKSHVRVRNIQHWDPARNWHHQPSIHNVDMQRPTDPAVYSYSANYSRGIPPVTAPEQTFVLPWNNIEVGNTWFDDDRAVYVPYFDEYAIRDEETRLRLWGSLATWGNIRLYEWVASDVPPAEYDDLAAIENGNVTIDVSIRKSGTSRKVVYIPDFVGAEPILDIDQVANTFTVETHIDLDFDWVGERFAATTTDIPNYPDYNGSYTITAIEYITGPDRTIVTVEETIPGAGVVGANEIAAPWIPLERLPRYTVDAAIDGVVATDLDPLVPEGIAFDLLLPLTVYPTPSPLYPNTTTDVYVNGLLHEEDVALDNLNTEIHPAGYYNVVGAAISDRVDFVQLDFTEAEIQTQVDAGIILYETPYSTDVSIDNLGIEIPVYYFWVENKNTITQPDMSATIQQAQIDLVSIPDPYIFFQKPLPAEVVTIEGGTAPLPVRFVQAIIRGLRGLIDADNRYTVRFTRDFTLRDSLEYGMTPLDLKDTHEEWEIFRREQQFNIPRWQWDLLTEALVGYKLNNTSIRVPSYERELYDDKYGTDTQYGIGEGQAFTDGALSLQTVLSYLLDPDNDFYPTDINVFFQRESFDTPENIESAMDTIYNTFNFEHVNNIYMDCLLDGFSVKQEYKGIFKTSMIALHGIRPFQISGVFDD